jgi:polyhydroxyalkanoate synthesis repressor PhaR
LQKSEEGKMVNEEGTPKIRIIKKYQNRKLYDTKDSCYITLDEIAKLIKKGEDVTVIDNKTKNDVTSIILTQILVDQEKSQKSILPLSMLKSIIRDSRGSLFDFIQRYVTAGFDSESGSKNEAERYLEKLVSRGEITKTESKSLLKEIEGTQKQSFDELKKQIDSVISSTLREISNLPALESNINNLYTKLEDSEARIKNYEKTLEQ